MMNTIEGEVLITADETEIPIPEGVQDGRGIFERQLPALPKAPQPIEGMTLVSLPSSVLKGLTADEFQSMQSSYSPHIVPGDVKRAREIPPAVWLKDVIAKAKTAEVKNMSENDQKHLLRLMKDLGPHCVFLEGRGCPIPQRELTFAVEEDEIRTKITRNFNSYAELMKEGALVKLRGLKARDYNGKIGKLGRRDALTGRWQVFFEDKTAPTLVMPINLDPCTFDNRGKDDTTAIWLYCAGEHIEAERIVLKLMDVACQYLPCFCDMSTYEEKLPYLERVVPEICEWESRLHSEAYCRLVADRHAGGSTPASYLGSPTEPETPKVPE